MTNLIEERDGFHPDPRDWDSWTDSDRWELGPDPASDEDTVDYVPSEDDARWAATQFGDTDDHFWDRIGELAILEAAALEAAAVDHLERSMIPPDALDRLMHYGTSPDWCICWRCVMDRTAKYATD